MNQKSSRHKPLYKNFILLRKNIQNRRRLNMLKFKKKKWEILITYLKRVQKRRKKNFPMYDINRQFLSKFSNSFKRKYSYKLRTNKKFKLFYGGLLQRYLKNVVKKTLKRKNDSFRAFMNSTTYFLNIIEKRLDVVLYRSHFATSVRLARQLILHKHIKVNKVVIKDYAYTLKKGDIIEVDLTGSKIVELSLQNSHFWPLPSKSLSINYKILQIVFQDINYQNHSTNFPFWTDLSTIIQNYRR